jgi:hypothetical protein
VGKEDLDLGFSDLGFVVDDAQGWDLDVGSCMQGELWEGSSLLDFGLCSLWRTDRS